MIPLEAAAIDDLETAIRETVENEATWLETQHALLRRALLLLRRDSDSTGRVTDASADPHTTQVERTLHLVSAAFRERLTSLDSAAAALRPE